MALSRDNPVAIEAIGDLTVQLLPQIDRLVKRIREADDDNAGWARRQLGFIRARFGKRPKKRVPWVGAANFNIPVVDGIMRRWRPGIASLVLDANPVAFFVGRTERGSAAARQIEPFFTWLLMKKMNIAPELVRLVDLIAARGHAYSREGWLYKIEEQARVVLVDHLFPNGVAEFLSQEREALLQAQLSGQVPDEPISDEVIIARELAREYGLSMEDEDELPMLVGAAQQILSGADKLRLTYERVEADRPDWRALDPLDVIVPREATKPEEADFFVIIHEMSRDDVARKGRDGTFAKEATQRLLASATARTDGGELSRVGGTGGTMVRHEIRDFMAKRAGNTSVDTTTNKLARLTLWEIFCRIDTNGDGFDERATVWYAPQFDIVLAAHDYVLPFNEWPVTDFRFESHAHVPTDSRGVPEMLSELNKLVNALHNARIDAAQIVLAPVMEQRISSANYGKQVQWRPGALLPVQQKGDISPIPQDLRILAAYQAEEQQTQRIAESFIGTFDATINQLNQPTERRTATEVQAITQLAQNVFGLDARMFQVSMARSLTKIWRLWLEFGPREVFLRVQGQEQPITITKADLEEDYEVVPAGSPSSTNKAFLLANMERILQIVINDQSGRFDVGALLEKYFHLIDYNLAKDIVRPPEQTQAAQAIMQAASQITGENFIF